MGSEMSTKRMGGMGKLSDFGKSPTSPVSEISPAVPDVVVTSTEVAAPKIATKVAPKKMAEDKLVTVNIKIKRSQQEWLADTAQAIRSNNTEPVSPSDRVFPQHLIGLAIELLKNADVKWDEIKTVKDLKQYLNL